MQPWSHRAVKIWSQFSALPLLPLVPLVPLVPLNPLPLNLLPRKF